MQVAVIGGGVVGVCTAYFLAAAGHDVVVIERYSNVSQETSFGRAGLVAPGCTGPWAAPGMPGKIFSHFLKSTAPALYKPSLDSRLWRWTKMWLRECELDRYRLNRARMQRIALYSHELLQQLRIQHALDDERTSGVLQLFRDQRELGLAQPGLALLAETDIEHRLVDTDAARLIEPALAEHTPLAAALYFPRDGTGNCPLFARHMKNIMQSMGVAFHFNSEVDAIASEGDRVSIRIGQRNFGADAVVIAAGAESMRLLDPLGIRPPLCRVKSYSSTAFIKNFDQTPVGAVVDERYKVSINRMGNRIRIAGMAEIGSHGTMLNATALRTLAKAGEDWFPDATNYSTATFWCGEQAMMPDGVPLLGATPVKNIFVNIGHDSAGWTMATGSGKVLADLISNRAPDIDIDGLTLARYELSNN